jgi:hypothetical protein
MTPLAVQIAPFKTSSTSMMEMDLQTTSVENVMSALQLLGKGKYHISRSILWYM